MQKQQTVLDSLDSVSLRKESDLNFRSKIATPNEDEPLILNTKITHLVLSQITPDQWNNIPPCIVRGFKSLIEAVKQLEHGLEEYKLRTKGKENNMFFRIEEQMQIDQDRNQQAQITIQNTIRSNNEKLESIQEKIMSQLSQFDGKILNIVSDIQNDRERIDTKINNVEDTVVVKKWVEAQLKSLNNDLQAQIKQGDQQNDQNLSNLIRDHIYIPQIVGPKEKYQTLSSYLSDNGKKTRQRFQQVEDKHQNFIKDSLESSNKLISQIQQLQTQTQLELDKMNSQFGLSLEQLKIQLSSKVKILDQQLNEKCNSLQQQLKEQNQLVEYLVRQSQTDELLLKINDQIENSKSELLKEIHNLEVKQNQDLLNIRQDLHDKQDHLESTLESLKPRNKLSKQTSPEKREEVSVSKSLIQGNPTNIQITEQRQERNSLISHSKEGSMFSNQLIQQIKSGQTTERSNKNFILNKEQTRQIEILIEQKLDQFEKKFKQRGSLMTGTDGSLNNMQMLKQNLMKNGGGVLDKQKYTQLKNEIQEKRKEQLINNIAERVEENLNQRPDSSQITIKKREERLTSADLFVKDEHMLTEIKIDNNSDNKQQERSQSPNEDLTPLSNKFQSKIASTSQERESSSNQNQSNFSTLVQQTISTNNQNTSVVYKKTPDRAQTDSLQIAMKKDSLGVHSEQLQLNQNINNTQLLNQNSSNISQQQLLYSAGPNMFYQTIQPPQIQQNQQVPVKAQPKSNEKVGNLQQLQTQNQLTNFTNQTYMPKSTINNSQKQIKQLNPQTQNDLPYAPQIGRNYGSVKKNERAPHRVPPIVNNQTPGFDQFRSVTTEGGQRMNESLNLSGIRQMNLSREGMSRNRIQNTSHTMPLEVKFQRYDNSFF